MPTSKTVPKSRPKVSKAGRHYAQTTHDDEDSRTRDDASLARDVATKTSDVLRDSVLDEMKRKLNQVYNAVFGHQNEDTNKYIPGLGQRIDAITFAVKVLTFALVLVNMPGFLHSLGVPTENLWNMASQAFGIVRVIPIP